MADLLSSGDSLRVIGRLAVGVSSSGGAFPHGGTDLGHAVVCEWVPSPNTHLLDGEEYSGEILEHIKMHERGLLVVQFAGFPDKAMELVLAHSSIGTSGSRKGGYGTAGDDGRLGSAGAVNLLFSPRYSTHPELLIYRAIADQDETARLRFFLQEGLGLAAVFRGIRDGSKGVYDWGRPGDLSP